MQKRATPQFRWFNTKSGALTNRAVPGSPMAVEVTPSDWAAAATVVVRHTTPKWVTTLLRRSEDDAPLFGEPLTLSRVPVTDEVPAEWRRFGPFEAQRLAWSPPPTNLVATAGNRRSGLLAVGSVGIELDLTMPIVAGIVTALRLKPRVIVADDPQLRLDVVTPGQKPWEDPGRWFTGYHAMVERALADAAYGLSAQQLDAERALAEWRYELRGWLSAHWEGEGGVQARLDTTELVLAPGESATVTLDLTDAQPGPTVVALLATDLDTGERTLSDPVGLTVDDDGNLTRDF